MFGSLFRKNAQDSFVTGDFVVARGAQSNADRSVDRRAARDDSRATSPHYRGEERRALRSDFDSHATHEKTEIDAITLGSQPSHIVHSSYASGTGSRVVTTAPKAPIMQLVKVQAASPLQPATVPLIGKAHPKVVRSEAELKAQLSEPYVAILQGVVALGVSDQCVCLYLGCAQVAVVMVEAFEKVLQFETICKTIEHEWMYQIRHVLYAPAALVTAIRDQCNSKLDRDPDFGLNHERRLKRLYLDIIEASFRMGATDIHLRSRDDAAEILVRLDGAPRKWLTLKKQLMLDMLAAGFGHYLTPGTTNAEQFKSNESQAFMTHHVVTVDVSIEREDGVVETKQVAKQVECRYNHKPHLVGLAAVIRLLESSLDIREVKTIEQLGYAASHCNALDLAMSRQWGLILFVGSTGQGKSTTLRSLYTHLPDAETQIIYTSESPAEYRYKYAIQFSVPVKTDDTPETKALNQVALIMDFLRMDPDRGMVGEIRDRSTAQIAIEFTQSGHPAASTIHGDGSIDALSRLTGDSMGVPAQDLAAAKTLNTVVYQRLLPLLCPGCKISASHPSFGLSAHKKNLIIKKFQLDPTTMYVANPQGCDVCRPRGIGLRGNGYKGQSVAAETFTPDAKAKSLIAVRDWVSLDSYWRGHRKTKFSSPDMTGKTAFEHGLYLCSIGRVSPLSLESNFEALELYEVHHVAVDGEPS